MMARECWGVVTGDSQGVTGGVVTGDSQGVIGGVVTGDGRGVSGDINSLGTEMGQFLVTEP